MASGRHNEGRPGVGAPDGRTKGRGRVYRQEQHSRSGAKRQAPLGTIPPSIDDSGLITIGGRKVASVRRGALLRTFGSHEFFMDGLSFRIDVLRVAIKHGAREIVVTERGTGHKWRIDIATFRAKGFEYNNKTFGRQWVCPMDAWTRCDGPEQRDLFGGGVAA